MKRLPWANWALLLATVTVSLAVPSVEGPYFGVADSQTPHHYSPLVLQQWLRNLLV